MQTVTILMAFTAGLLSFLSPCILPVAPGYISIISGTSLTNLKEGSFRRGRVLLATGAFILGFSIVFILFGMTSSLLGQFLTSNRPIIARIGGVIVILFGLHQAGWLPISWLYQERRVNLQNSIGIAGSFLAGLAFSIGWTPCVGPVLGSILTLAGSQANILQGAMLLTVYSLGLAVPFLLLALAFESISGVFNKLKPYLKYLEWASGLLLIFMGILLFTGSFPALTSWIMQFTGGWSPEQLFIK